MSDLDQIVEQTAAAAVFALDAEYARSLLYYEADEELDEAGLKDKLLQLDKVAQAFLLYGERRALVVAKTAVDDLLEQLDEQVRLSVPQLRRRPVPHLGRCVAVPPLLLVSEIGDGQLRLLAENRSDAISKLEAKTGLRRLKKLTTGLFFTGLLFQFELLNQMLNDSTQELSISTTLPAAACVVADSSTSSFVSVSSSLNNDRQPTPTPEQVNPPPPVVTAPPADWRKLYQESKVAFNLKIKPKNVTYLSAEGEGEGDFVYDVYIFQADLTELNTDALVNANQSSLHPGYSAECDGISQRVREKGGKLMSDACKKIRASRSDHSLADSEVVLTKAYGKLRAKYVLHAIEPKWTKYVVEGLAAQSDEELLDRYEALLEQTFANVLAQAHQPELQVRSLAYPCASSAAGGAFDVPIKLLAHVIYTQLVDFPLMTSGESTSTATALGTVCITSLEESCVQAMGEIFQNYTECYSTSSWAIPTSPMAELLAEAKAEAAKAPRRPSAKPPAEPERRPPPQVTILTRQRKRNDSSLTEFESDAADNHDKRKNPPAVVNGGGGHFEAAERKVKPDPRRHDDHFGKPDIPLADRLGPKVSSNTNKRTRGGFKSNEDEGPVRHGYHSFGPHQDAAAVKGHYHADQHAAATGQFHPQQAANFVNNRSRQNSNSSSNYSSSHENSGGGHLPAVSRRLDSLDQDAGGPRSRGGKSCLFCQSEVSSKIVECGNADCSSAFCMNCIVDHLNKQRSQKCPSCKNLVGKEIAGRLLSNRLSSSSPTRQQQQQLPFNKNNTYNNITNLPISNHKMPPQQHKNADRDQAPMPSGITQGNIKIRSLPESCEGYEGYESLMITFDIQDGIQNENHPKPGKPYRGIMKQAYLPKIEGHRELLALYDRALKSGNLFKIGLNKDTNEYRVHIDSEILLKTSMRGGGRFGYPDKNYISNLFGLAKRI